MTANRTVSILRCKWLNFQVSRPVCLAVKPHLGPKTRFFVAVREVANTIGWVNCCRPSPAQSFVASVSSRSMNKISVPLLDMYVFRNGASSSTREGSVFMCRRYVCCTVVSARAYPRCHGVQVTVDCHCTVLSNIYARYTEICCQCRLLQRLDLSNYLKLEFVSWTVVGLTAAKF
jgi:hypothetical protein